MALSLHKSRSKKLNRTFLAAAIGGTVVLCAVVYFIFIHDKEPSPQTSYVWSENATTSPQTPEVAANGLPVRLIIPGLEVDTNILYMGLTPDGHMAVADDNFKDVGWYQYGARPGSVGTAVLAGHVNGKNERGVFIDLHKMKKGDIVKIVDDKNQTISFAVRDIRTYDQDERPQEVFHSEEGVHLNLVTCAGEWNDSEQQFPVRLVVFTDKIEA